MQTTAEQVTPTARTELAKTLKPQWVWAIAFGSAIGWGSFVLPATWLAQAGPLGTILGFLIGGLLMSIIAVSYGFLIRNFPVSGGEFAYAYLGFGRNHAFVCGWFLALGYLSIIALNASAVALLAKFTLPEIANVGFLYELAGWRVYFNEVAIASIVLIAFAWLNLRGAELSGRMQFVFCLMLAVGGILLLVGVLATPEGSLANVHPPFKPGVSAVAAVLGMIAIAPWAYVGFDNVPQAAEEFDFSASKAFGLIIMAIVSAALFYAATVTFTAAGMPWQELAARESLWGTGDVVLAVLGKAGLAVLIASLLMGIFTGLNGFYVSASRLLFAMGRARILPRIFYELHPRYRTPTAALVFACIVCMAGPWFGREVLLWVVSMSATGVTVGYFYACAAAFRLFAWSGGGSTGKRDGAVAPFKKALSLLGALCSLAFLGLLLVPGSPAFLSTPAWTALLLWIGLGIAFYVVKGRAYRSIPEETLDHLILGNFSKNPAKD